MITIEQMVQREVNCCLSSLVSTLAQAAGGFDSLSGGSEKGVAPLRDLSEQASELASPVLDYEEAATQAGWTQQPGGRWWREPLEDERESERHEMFLGSGPFTYAESAEDACECDGLEPYEWEVYEYWAVSQWLADKLIEQGERVDTDFAGLNVWARTTTGQAISMDGCMQRIYADMMAPLDSVAPGA